MPDLISRNAACDCMGQMIHEYREKGEDGLADGIILARRYGIERLPAVDAVPTAKLKAVANIALELVNKYEESACNLIWDTSTSPAEDENEIHIECHKYRHRIKLFAGMKGEQNA